VSMTRKREEKIGKPRYEVDIERDEGVHRGRGAVLGDANTLQWQNRMVSLQAGRLLPDVVRDHWPAKPSSARRPRDRALMAVA
jgi:hypothetical protein